MASWTNSDGLTLYYGVTEGQGAVGGEYKDHPSGLLVTDILLDLKLLTTSANSFLSRDLVPNNMILEQVDLFTEVAATGSSGTLDIGFYDLTAAATISDTGAVAVATLASIAAVGTLTHIVIGSSFVGTLVGLPIYAGSATGAPFTAHQVAINAKIGSGTFTAGRIRVRLYMRRTLAADTSSSIDD